MGKLDQAAERKCLLCGSRRKRIVFEEFGVDIVRCGECRHVFSLYEREAHYEGFWGEEVADERHVYWRQARARMYEDFADRFLTGRSGRLLDMGCGLGFFLKGIAHRGAWEGYGSEISAAAVRYAQERLGLANVMCTRLEDAGWPEESFEIVTLWDVIDHIPAPDPLLRRCHALLKPGGMCFIRTPNVAMHLPRARLKRLVRGMRRGVLYLQARDHLHHYSRGSIRKLLERNGFDEVEFLHLRPVESVAHDTSRVARRARGMWFQTVRALAVLSGGRLNFDNLFVVARKSLAWMSTDRS